MNNQIAKEILRQIGGNKFIVMTGAYDIMTDKQGSLICKVKNAKYNYIKITLNHNDLYDLELIKYSRSGILKKADLKDIFCEEV